MSTTESPRTFVDLFSDLINRVRADGADTDGTTTNIDLAKRYINLSLQDMHIGTTESVPWAERSRNLITQPKYDTGTVSINIGSTALVGVLTEWNTANTFGTNNARVGGKIRLNGSRDTYKVTAVNSDTSITLSPAFIGEANLSAAAYIYFEDDYALDDDFLRPIHITKFDDNNEIDIISRTDFRKFFPRNNIVGKPNVCMFFDDDFDGNTTRVRKIRFHRPPDRLFIFPYSFITNKLIIDASGVAKEQFSADTDEPIVPLQYRFVIVLKALEIWYRDRKDDARSQEVAQEYNSILLRILSDQEFASPRLKFRPNVSPYRRRARSPWRNTGRFSTDDRFDNLEDRFRGR